MTFLRQTALFALTVLALPNCSLAQEALAPAVETEVPASQSDSYRQLQMFGEAFERVREKYVEPVTDE